jgi:phage gp45-like
MNLAKRITFAQGIGRVVVPATTGGNASTLQVTVPTTGELIDGMPLLQHYGFASALLAGCDVYFSGAQGDSSKRIAIATNDQRFKPKTLLGGESQQHDNAGQFFYLQGGTKAVVNAVTEIDFEIGGVLVAKFTSAGLFVVGNVTWGYGGSDSGDGQGHKHNVVNVQGGSDTIETTPPVAGT